MTARTDFSTDFSHVVVPATDPAAPPLLLLHGTGGDERDLLELARAVSPGSALLSPRGRVSENGAPRFFRRHAEGVLDEDDLRARTHELADWVEARTAAHGLAAPLALGFSNGANIAAAMLLLRPATLAGGVLMRAMAPFAAAPSPRTSPGSPPAPAPDPAPARSALILAGLADPIAPAPTVTRLVDMLTGAGLTVDRRETLAGHGLVREDLNAARAWIAAARG